ncbi:MAG: M1 family peptidase, partial [Bacteroidota bacterium]
MKRFLFWTFYLLLLTFNSFSQYFQQEVNYKINVSLNDKSHELNAYETIEYINNSPAALNEIWFHLWANAYKDNSTALVKQ